MLWDNPSVKIYSSHCLIKKLLCTKVGQNKTRQESQTEGIERKMTDSGGDDTQPPQKRCQSATNQAEFVENKP